MRRSGGPPQSPRQSSYNGPMSRQPQFIDALVVGQGLAGSLVAWELIRRQRRVVVVEPGRPDAASRVAGGIISPVTGPRFSRPPELERLISDATDLYGEIEDCFRFVVFRQTTIHRVLRDDLEVAQATKRHEDPKYAPYLSELQPSGSLGPAIHDPRGSVQVRGARLSPGRLLDRLRDFFRDTARLVEMPFSAKDLVLRGNRPEWRGYRPRHVIFCEGWQVRENPWFHWAPVRPSKGETLTVEIDGELPEGILNAGHWLIPLGENWYRLGATFRRDETDCEPTEAGRRELLEAARGMLATSDTIRVIQHDAGVRPGKTDKYPVLGRHPDHPQLALLNGLGSRGALLAPHYARLLADHLEKASPIPQAADIRSWHAKAS